MTAALIALGLAALVAFLFMLACGRILADGNDTAEDMWSTSERDDAWLDSEIEEWRNERR